jgi:NitT/TauT family transport system substrate-binding protein
MNRYGKICWLLVGLLALLLPACREGEKPLPVLRLGHAPHDHHAPLYVAALNPDYFRTNGGIYLQEKVFRQEYLLVDHDKPLAKVVIDASTGGNELIRKLAEGLFDMCFGGVPAMLSFIDQGSPIRIVAPVMAEGTGLVVRRDLPVADWPQFVSHVRQSGKPVKIGYKFAVSVQNLLFEQALRESGISFVEDGKDNAAQVRLVNLYGEKNIIPVLESGLVDGVVIMQPYLAMAEERGAGKVIALLRDLPPAGKWQGSPCCALAASDAFSAAHPEVARAMVTLMLRSIAFINLDPNKSAEEVARWLNISPAVEMRSIPTIRFEQEFSKDWERGIRFWTESMIKSGLLTGRVKEAYAQGNLNQVIYNRELFDKAKKDL